MRKTISSIIISLFILSNITFSQDFQDVSTESWYTYWGLGYSSISYPGELQKVLDYLNDQNGVSNTSLSLDILGIYFHIAPKTIGGVIINGVADRYEKDGDFIQINQYLYSLSAMHYLGDYFGSGPFLRADVGLANLLVQTSEGSGNDSENGFGILVGGGWSFDFGGTRLLLNLNYAYRGVEDKTYNTIGFSVGGLF
jgi:opacity protein-like surface antigen